MKLALFDLDKTLLPIDSDHGWGEFIQKINWVDAVQYKARNDAFYQDYLAQRLDLNAYIDFATQPIRQKGIEASLKARAQFMQEVIKPALMPQALELVKKHLDEGYECILVTATNDFVTRPISKALGFKHLIATDLEYDINGTPTGRIVGTPSFQAGKVRRVNEWLRDRGRSWEELKATTFYSDSINDLPLLEVVDVPVVTNPDPELEEIAQERGWEILRLFA